MGGDGRAVPAFGFGRGLDAPHEGEDGGHDEGAGGVGEPVDDFEKGVAEAGADDAGESSEGLIDAEETTGDGGRGAA